MKCAAACTEAAIRPVFPKPAGRKMTPSNVSPVVTKQLACQRDNHRLAGAGSAGRRDARRPSDGDRAEDLTPPAYGA